jgi:adenylate kinase
LYQRDDDIPETVQNRIHVYNQQTTPLIDYFKGRKLLAEIDGSLPIEKVTEALLVAISKAV